MKMMMKVNMTTILTVMKMSKNMSSVLTVMMMMKMTMTNEDYSFAEREGHGSRDIIYVDVHEDIH